MDGPTVLALYRYRWQVELAFKRLKTLLDLEALRNQRNSRLGEVWIRGKLLYALVIERRAQRHAAGGIDLLDRPRRLTPWRLLIIVRQEVDRWILEVQRWRDEHWDTCLDVLKERPRRRRLQTLPARVMQMMNSQVSQRCG
ncbi:transposase [Thiocystis violascens]|uniref:transposase n=1 Tax=Thiocystis violascens TaxID=73141 RepID=UPI0006944A89|nr:transposase [Thiocystis violascens]